VEKSAILGVFLVFTAFSFLTLSGIISSRDFYHFLPLFSGCAFCQRILLKMSLTDSINLIATRIELISLPIFHSFLHREY